MNSSQITHISQTLSKDRIQTYLNKSGDLEESLELYIWNAQISGAFLLPLQICEVTIRNAISQGLANKYSLWINNPRFINRLPSNPKSYEPLKDIQSAIAKLQKQNKPLTIANIIPELNFVFWQSMFTQRHEKHLWSSQFLSVFPNTNNANTTAKNMADIYQDLDKIRRLRNRIAHHEPIFDEKLLSIYNKIIKIIGYRCQETANWVSSHQTVTTLIAQKPKI